MTATQQATEGLPGPAGGVPVAPLVRLGTRVPPALKLRLELAALIEDVPMQERLWAALERDLPALTQLQSQLGTEEGQE